MADQTPGTAPVTDHAPPRGVLPRGAQTWLMVGLALGILAIIVVTGRPAPPVRPAPAAASPAAAPSPDRLRDYQDRLRVLDERSRQQAQASRRRRPAAPVLMRTPVPQPRRSARRGEATPRVREPVRQQRRPEPAARRSAAALDRRPDAVRSARPSVDSAAVAAESRRGRGRGRPRDRALRAGASAPPQHGRHRRPGPVSRAATTRVPARPTAPDSASGPTHRLLEGTLIDAVLTNRLDGASAAPVNCLVTNPVYSHSGQHVVIPAGARVLGETKPVQALGETRLAVSFHRLVLPDGRTYPLDQFMGLNQIGDAGLRDQVNQHYLSTFGAAAAVGLITGLSQFLGTAGFGRADARPHGRHRGRRRRCHGTGHRTGDAAIPEPAADHHDSRGTPGQGLPDERPRVAGVRRRAERRPASSRRRHHALRLIAAGLLVVAFATPRARSWSSSTRRTWRRPS